MAKRRSGALISLGSNLGCRSGFLRAALKRIAAFASVDRTSHLYETAPMHVEDQPRFLNAAAALSTTLSPHELLARLQEVERELGRVHGAGVRYGPRVIDLDILRFGEGGDAIVVDDAPTLTIPHARIAEREFVLRPLLDIVPDDAEALRFAAALAPSSDPPRRVIALGRCGGKDGDEATIPWGAGSDAVVMGIVNATPDSFSGDGVGGGEAEGGGSEAVMRAADQAERMVAAGAALIDVGGQSTRPGAVAVGAAEEAARVVPVVEELRRRCLGVPVSVDTYYASVARAAVNAGANCVNDISAGALDAAMASTVSELAVPAILMHMRGTPENMQALAVYGEEKPDGAGTTRGGGALGAKGSSAVVRAVASELAPRFAAFERAGMPRWDLVLDPGIGFAKTTAHNVEVLCGLRELRVGAEYAQLVGLSRKRFLGELCAESASGARDDAAARVWGTAAACAFVVAEGADIIRVHDVEEMVDVAHVANALRRQKAR